MKVYFLIHYSLILCIIDILKLVFSWDINQFEYDDNNLHRANERRVQSHYASKSVLNDAMAKEELTIISTNIVQKDLKLIKSDVKNKQFEKKKETEEVVDNSEDHASKLFLINMTDNPITKINNNNLNAIVHIGPQKTGSSSIQEFMKKYLLDTLILDHYERVPDTNTLADYSFTSCFDRLNAQITTSLGKDDYHCHQSIIQNTINISINHYNNLFITSETIPNLKFNISLFQQFIYQYWNHDTIVIVYYRRFYSWIHSLHNEQNKNKQIPDRTSMVDYVSNTKLIDQIYKGYYFNGTVQRFQQYYTNPNSIRMFSVHHDIINITLIEHFFCIAITELSNTCQKTRQVINEKGGSIKNSNTAKDLVYSELVYEAKEMNLFSSDTMYRLVNDPSLLTNLSNTAKYHQEYILQLPIDNFGNIEHTLVCPTDDTHEHLLNLTLLTEKKFFPQYFNESEIYLDFHTQYVLKNKFCHVNVSAVLYYNSNGWRDFFQDLVL